MLVIFDGVDGVGKTTIAKQCAEALGFPYVDPYFPEAASNSMKKNFVDFSFKLLDSFKKVLRSCVIDRFFASEYVYAKLFKRRKSLNDIFRAENELLRGINITNIIVLLRERKIPNYDVKAHELFEEYAAKTKIPTIILYNDGSVEEAVRKSLKFIYEVMENW